jgi:hypothetical protein
MFKRSHGFRIVTILLLALIAWYSRPVRPVIAQTAPQLGGEYNMVGLTPEGHIYYGKLNITQEGEQYNFAWETSGGSKTTGIGILDVDGVSVGWGSEKCTVATYTVGENGLENGKWFPIGGKDSGTETATLQGSTTDGRIAGEYAVEGTNPDGTAYKSAFSVTPNGQTYQFAWTQASGVVQGHGVLWGSVVTVGWGDPNCTAATYLIRPDGSLSGLWTVADKSNVGVEQAKVSIDGTYAITGTRSDDSTYSGDLKITERGPVYQFSWDIGAAFEGVGIRQGGTVSVGWGDPACGIVSYRLLDNDTLLGFSGQYGKDAIGAELLTRAEKTGELSGDYAVTGVDVNNTGYTGTASITQNNDIYLVNWTVGDQTVQGVGARIDDVLSVATGGEKCAFIAYQIDANKTLDGVYGNAASVKLGSETGAPK